MEHFSVLAGVFSRKKQNRFPQRNEPPSAKTKLFCRKAAFAGEGRKEKQGFGGLFPLWMESARVQTSFVFLPTIPFVGMTRVRAPAARRSVADGKMSRKAAFGFHLAFPWAHEVRVFPSCSRPVPVCAILAGAVLTF